MLATIPPTCGVFLLPKYLLYVLFVMEASRMPGPDEVSECQKRRLAFYRHEVHFVRRPKDDTLWAILPPAVYLAHQVLTPEVRHHLMCPQVTQAILRHGIVHGCARHLFCCIP